MVRKTRDLIYCIKKYMSTPKTTITFNVHKTHSLSKSDYRIPCEEGIKIDLQAYNISAVMGRSFVSSIEMFSFPKN
jgi:hypothetical protein